MFYTPPIDQPPELHRVIVAAARDPLEEVEGGFDSAGGASERWFDVSRHPLPPRLEIGETSYPLRTNLVGEFLPGHAGEDGEFIVPEFCPEFVGRGRSLNAALVDWSNQVHYRFQELDSKRPFERTEAEKATWRLLESQIDVFAYRRATPLTIRQIGKIARARPFPDSVKWEDGQQEQVRPDQAPGEFVTYKPGQPFEAIVARDPVNFRLTRILHIQKLRSVPPARPEDVEELRHSIQTTSALPDCDWK